MEFDTFTVVFLVLRSDAPNLSEDEANELQDAHMAYLAKMHDEGVLLAAGPFFDPEIRGLSLFAVGPEEALRLHGQDPAVQAGKYSLRATRWMVPSGADFRRIRLPRSMAEATT